MNKIDLVEIGKRIQNRRKQRGLTQEQLADLMNVSIQMISNLERGNKAVRIDNLLSLSKILNVSTDYILTGKGNPQDISELTSKISRLPGKTEKMIEMLVDYCISEEI